MNIREAEQEKLRVEQLISQSPQWKDKNIVVLIIPSHEADFKAFEKMRRNTTYVVALAAFGHCDMALFISDPSSDGSKLVPLQDFLDQSRIS